MSGICGICEAGRQFDAQNLGPMLAALELPEEAPPQAVGGTSVGLGAARRWPFQQVATVAGMRVAADADLCNARELAEMLPDEGARTPQLNVAELLARLYARRGIQFLELLHGDFSLALWDEQARRLILAIDRRGVRTLYWRQEADRLLFASRAGAVRAAQSGPAEVAPASIMQFLLFSAVPAPLSIYRGVEKLPPGTCLIFETGVVRQHRYWDLEFPESKNRDVRYWSRELREAMRAAVDFHLEGCAAEDTGAFLSGGTDSSSVVAFMSDRFSPVNTFSISFQEEGYSESGFARTTAQCFGTRHYEKCLTPEHASEAVEKISQYFDEPFANSSAVGAYHCALLARANGVQILMAGDGGDELFAGNHRYVRDRYFALYHSIPAALRKGLIEPAVSLLPNNGSWASLPRRYVRRANIPNPRRLFSYGFFFNLDPREVFEPDFLAEVPPDSWLAIPEAHFRRAQARTELNRQLYMDVKMTLADNDLRKVSGTAELAGIRVRYPLLDYRLAELSGLIPSELKLKGFEKRYIFKQAMKGILPRKVLYKKKHGFGVPLSLWLLRDARMSALMQDLLHDRRTRQRGYFRAEFFDRLVDLHRRDQPQFYGEIVWYLVSLELWHRQHLERQPEGIHAH